MTAPNAHDAMYLTAAASAFCAMHKMDVREWIAEADFATWRMLAAKASRLAGVEIPFPTEATKRLTIQSLHEGAAMARAL